MTISTFTPVQPNRIDTTSIKARIDLRELAGAYTTLRRESAKEMSGPCPKPGCGATTDGFHVKPDQFMCRKCHPEWGDVFEFLHWLHGYDFLQAAQWLEGGALVGAGAKRKPQPKRVSPAQWDEGKARRELAADQTALMDDANSAAHDYLLGRGLTPDTWLAYGLGYRHRMPLPGTWDVKRKEHSHPPQPAIALPWYMGSRLVAVRYRFLQSHTYTGIGEDEPRTEKQTARGSFAGCIHGGHVLNYMPQPEQGAIDALGLRNLVICEGEINGASIWQVAHRTKLDVLSLGSESQKIPESTIAYARRYGAVLVWADRDDVGRGWKQAVNEGQEQPNAYHIASEMCGGNDANDLLRDGTLGYYLTTWRSQVAADKERLLWDLIDGDGSLHLLDDGTRHVMNQLAAQLGKSI